MFKKLRSIRALEQIVDADWRRDRTRTDEIGFNDTISAAQLIASAAPFMAKYVNSAGAMYPFFANELQLDNVRARCRVVSQAFPMAICAMGNLVNYTVGTGYKFKVQSRYGNVADDFVRQAQEILDEFIERTDFAYGVARELFQASREDGDQAAVLFERGDGSADIRLIQGEYITQPSDPQRVERWLGERTGETDWSFGVRTVKGDAQTVLGYYVQWSGEPGDFDYFPAEDVELVKCNVRSNVKRGLSDLHAVLSWLYLHHKLARNTALGAAILASIVYIEEYAENVSKVDAEAVALGGASYTYDVDGGSGSSEQRYATPHEGASVVGLSQGLKYVPGPGGSERNPNFIAVQAAVARLLGCRWCMPEYLISGDASNANYASTMVAESPWVKATEARQAPFGRTQTNILNRVLYTALRAGRLHTFSVQTLDELRKALQIIATPPQVAVRDRTSETTRHETLVNAGIESEDTWAAAEGLDLKAEIKKGAKRAEFKPMPLPAPAPTARDIVKEMWQEYP
jgi:hypothetical protein